MHSWHSIMMCVTGHRYAYAYAHVRILDQFVCERLAASLNDIGLTNKYWFATHKSFSGPSESFILL